MRDFHYKMEIGYKERHVNKSDNTNTNKERKNCLLYRIKLAEKKILILYVRGQDYAETKRGRSRKLEERKLCNKLKCLRRILKCTGNKESVLI